MLAYVRVNNLLRGRGWGWGRGVGPGVGGSLLVAYVVLTCKIELGKKREAVHLG